MKIGKSVISHYLWRAWGLLNKKRNYINKYRISCLYFMYIAFYTQMLKNQLSKKVSWLHNVVNVIDQTPDKCHCLRKYANNIFLYFMPEMWFSLLFRSIRVYNSSHHYRVIANSFRVKALYLGHKKCWTKKIIFFIILVLIWIRLIFSTASFH